MKKDYLVDLIERASEESRLSDRAIALWNLAQVIKDRPAVSAGLQRAMAEELRRSAQTVKP